MSEETVIEGAAAPDFELEATRDGKVRLSDLRGKLVVLYFYPRDDTPGCTQEGQEFRDRYPQFQELGAEVLGISRDSLASHEKFAAKQEFPFPLLADPDEAVCNAYGVMKEKNMYGKKVWSVERSTFVIDADGVIRHAHRKVKVDGHVDQVLEEVRGLAG
ncbi:peroxiredoxin [Thiohalorhabdus sp. Cl-TMA]|uniref:thioredoxin-dependent peroxiredoxin n=1 Tax=Thiohalorhabdus methylotrophus TaxID=3242694 RepID=A0ABV4TSR5_9GAMM